MLAEDAEDPELVDVLTKCPPHDVRFVGHEIREGRLYTVKQCRRCGERLEINMGKKSGDKQEAGKPEGEPMKENKMILKTCSVCGLQEERLQQARSCTKCGGKYWSTKYSPKIQASQDKVVDDLMIPSLMQYLPPDRWWTKVQRDRWIAALGAILDLEIEVKEK